MMAHLFIFHFLSSCSLRPHTNTTLHQDFSSTCFISQLNSSLSCASSSCEGHRIDQSFLRDRCSKLMVKAYFLLRRLFATQPHLFSILLQQELSHTVMQSSSCTKSIRHRIWVGWTLLMFTIISSLNVWTRTVDPNTKLSCVSAIDFEFSRY